MRQEWNPIMSVPYGATVHGDEEIEAVVKVLKTSTQMGLHVAQFEANIAALFAKRFGVMLNSGSSANYLAIEILNLPAGCEIITPILTFSTTVAPLVKHHLVPAFVDVERETFNIDINQIEEMISPLTRAMMIPNLLGNLPDWSQLRELADHYHLTLIEDSADTLGATLGEHASGIYSDMSTTSFYGSHVINCAGNGGMLCVNDENQAKQIKLLRSWGRSSSLLANAESIADRFNTKIDDTYYDAKFIFETIGYNLEPSEMGAAFGLVQLKKLENNIELREKYFKAHFAFFKAHEHYFMLPKQTLNTRTGWLAFPFIVRDDAPFSRRELQIYLECHGIQTRTILTGNILRQPGFAKIPHKASQAGYPHADLVMRNGLLIGCHHGLTTEMMDYIHQTLSDFIYKA